jgi:hygromycin-B 4-O-kinase
MYGDFMFDAAVLHLWVPQLRFPHRFREAWEEKGQPIPHFDERLLCYQLFKGVDGLRFYAKKGDKPGYDFIKARLLSLAEGR